MKIELHQAVTIFIMVTIIAVFGIIGHNCLVEVLSGIEESGIDIFIARLLPVLIILFIVAYCAKTLL